MFAAKLSDQKIVQIWMLSIVRWHVWLPEGTWVNAKRASLQFYLYLRSVQLSCFPGKPLYITVCIYIEDPKGWNRHLTKYKKWNMRIQNTFIFNCTYYMYTFQYIYIYIFHMLFASSLGFLNLKLYPTIVVDLRPNSRDTGTKAKVSK